MKQISNEKIEISLEEYKELILIKGKYEELKSICKPYFTPTITYNGIRLYENELNPPYKVTCKE